MKVAIKDPTQAAMKTARALGWVAVAVAAVCAVARPALAADTETATPEEAVNNVRGAAQFLHDKGSAGFAEFNNKDGKWVWKDSYVFVYDCRRNRMLAHPLRPDLVGQPIMQVTDNSGKFIFKELCKVGAEPRGGWVEYMWTKPGAGKLSRKVSYALPAEISFTTGIQVSAGVYDDKITLPELNKVTEKVMDPAKYPAL